MSFVIETNKIPLFHSTGDFHAEAKLSYTKDENARTFTVKVDGVRGYCKYQWNFNQNIEMWLGTSATGGNKNSNAGKIARSGSNDYRGWIPRTDYNTDYSFSKTYNYNDDGTVPEVWFYLKNYNNSIYWISQGKNTTVNVSCLVNISSHIAAIGPKDVDPPTLTLSLESIDSSKGNVNWKCKSDYSVNNWKSNITDWSYSSTTNTTEISGTRYIGNTLAKLQLVGTKASNGKTGVSNELKIDNRIPTISELSLAPESKTSGKLAFKCDYDVDFRLIRPDKTKTEWYNNYGKSISANVTILENVNDSYTLEVRRTSDKTNYWFNDLKSSKKITCDTKLPEIYSASIKAISSTKGTLSLTTSHPVDFRVVFSDKVKSDWYLTNSKNITKDITLLDNTDYNYVIEVRRSGVGADSWKNYLTNTKTVRGDTRIPETNDFKLSVVNNNTSKLTFTVANKLNSNNKFKIYYELYGGNKKLIEKSIVDKEVEYTFNHLSDNYKDKYTLKLYRDGTNLTNTYEKTHDTRLITSTITKLEPTSENTANLSFSLNFNFNKNESPKSINFRYRLYNNKNKKPDWSNPIAFSTPINNVSVSCEENKISNYYLEIKREGRKLITVSKGKELDNKLPEITSKSIEVLSRNEGRLKLTSSHPVDFRVVSPNKAKTTWYINDTTNINSKIKLVDNDTVDYKIEVRRHADGKNSWKNYLKNNAEIKNIDTRVPELTNISFSDVTNKTSCLKFTSNNKFKIYYELYIGSKKLIDKTNVATTVNYKEHTFNHKSKSTGYNCFSKYYKLKVFRDNNNLFTEYTKTHDTRLIEINTITLTPTSRNSAKLSFTLKNNESKSLEGIKFQYRLCSDNIKPSWSDPVYFDTTTFKNIQVKCEDNTITNYWLEIRRNDFNGLITKSYETIGDKTECDTRVPIPKDIYFNIFGIERDKALIYYQCELDTKIELINTIDKKTYYSIDKLAANTLYTLTDIPVADNSLANYKLKVTHVNNKLSSYIESITCDTRLPNISLVKILDDNKHGCQVDIEITSDLKCSEFYLSLTNKDTGDEIKSTLFASAENTNENSIEKVFSTRLTFSDLEPGDKYILSVSGKRDMSDIEEDYPTHKLISDSITSEEFTVNGGIWILSKNNGLICGTIYLCISSNSVDINAENKWEPISPYICISADEDGGNPKWERLK